jgi:hypothetical protein
MYRNASIGSPQAAGLGQGSAGKERKQLKGQQQQQHDSTYATAPFKQLTPTGAAAATAAGMRSRVEGEVPSATPPQRHTINGSRIPVPPSLITTASGSKAPSTPTPAQPHHFRLRRQLDSSSSSNIITPASSKPRAACNALPLSSPPLVTTFQPPQHPQQQHTPQHSSAAAAMAQIIEEQLDGAEDEVQRLQQVRCCSCLVYEGRCPGMYPTSVPNCKRESPVVAMPRSSD